MLDDRFYVSRGPFTIADIVEGLEVKLPNPKFLDETITYPAQIEGAKPGAIIFVGSKKSLSKLENCKATACFVTEELSHHIGALHIIPLITRYPRAHFARAMEKLGSLKTLLSGEGTTKKPDSPEIHTSVFIGANSEIGPNVSIGPNSVIGPGVIIGEGSSIGPNVTIEATMTGKNCEIKAGAVIGGRGFGIDKDEHGVVHVPHFGRAILGDNVQIGANSCIDRGQLGDTVLGDNVKLDNLVQIGHNVSIGEGSRLAAHVGVSGSCSIGENAMIGGAVGIADHIDIGNNVHIAGQAGVMSNIPDGEYWGGTPAQPMKRFMREVAMTRKLARKSKKASDET